MKKVELKKFLNEETFVKVITLTLDYYETFCLYHENKKNTRGCFRPQGMCTRIKRSAIRFDCSKLYIDMYMCILKGYAYQRGELNVTHGYWFGGLSLSLYEFARVRRDFLREVLELYKEST